MAPPNDSTGCFSGTAHFFNHLFNKMIDLFKGRHRNNISSVQPGENIEHNSNRRRLSMSNTQTADDKKGEKQSKHDEASMKVMSGKTVEKYEQIHQFSDDEDVCPTCLEEYSPENPKITTKCCHHYHLGCIYEWKERSDRCPVCYRVMVFEETV